MNQLFLAAVALAITLQMVAGAPITVCDKLEAVIPNYNQYNVLLQDDHTPEDAKRIEEVVNEYQSSLDVDASGHGAQSVLINQLTYSHNDKLSGTLSEEAILLVCMENKVKSIRPDYKEWLQTNLCRDFSKAVTLFGLNETESQRYMITFHYDRRAEAQETCEVIENELRPLTDQDLIVNCKQDIKQISGELSLNAVQRVCNYPSARIGDRVRVIEDVALSPFTLGETSEDDEYY